MSGFSSRNVLAPTRALEVLASAKRENGRFPSGACVEILLDQEPKRSRLLLLLEHTRFAFIPGRSDTGGRGFERASKKRRKERAEAGGGQSGRATEGRKGLPRIRCVSAVRLPVSVL